MTPMYEIEIKANNKWKHVSIEKAKIPYRCAYCGKRIVWKCDHRYGTYAKHLCLEDSIKCKGG